MSAVFEPESRCEIGEFEDDSIDIDYQSGQFEEEVQYEDAVL